MLEQHQRVQMGRLRPREEPGQGTPGAHGRQVRSPVVPVPPCAVCAGPAKAGRLSRVEAGGLLRPSCARDPMQRAAAVLPLSSTWAWDVWVLGEPENKLALGWP